MNDIVSATTRVEKSAFDDPSAADPGSDESSSEATAPQRRKILLAAVACGVARAALRVSLAGLDAAAAVSQSVQTRLADMAAETEGAWLLTMKAAACLGRGEQAELEAALAQAQAIRAVLQAASSAASITGARGLAEGSAAQGLTHAARRCEVAAGDCDEARRLLARALLQR